MIETLKWMFCCCSDSSDHLIKPGCFPHWFLRLQYSITGSVSNPATVCVQPLQRDKRVYTEIEFRRRDRSYNHHFQAKCGHKSLQLDHKHCFKRESVFYSPVSLPSHSCLLFLPLTHTQTHTFNLIPFRIVTNTHTIDLLWKRWFFRCSRPSQRIFVAGMLIVGMPPHAYVHTHTHTHIRIHWVFDHCSPPARVVMSFCLLQRQQRRQARGGERNVRSEG